MSAPNIALTGKMRSGKDTVAEYLVKHYGYTRFAFGDGIRDICRQLYPDQFADDRKPRALLQGFGQDARKYDPDVWVRKCFDAISRRHYDCIDYNENPDDFRAVITDLRQPNEYRRCRAEGFVIILVHAPDHIRLERARQAGDAFTAADLTHETEMYVDTFPVDYVIYNKYTLDELYTQIDVIMSRYRPQ